MGVPSVPVASPDYADAWRKLPSVRMHFRAPVERIGAEGFAVGGENLKADAYVCALPFERLEAVGMPAPKLDHSPITGVHLWFAREITTLPHATRSEERRVGKECRSRWSPYH